MHIIGLTGSFGTGKSTVSRMFAARGAKILDADRIVHELISGTGPCAKAIVKKIGNEILAGKRINRTKLAKIVFNDRGKLEKLERIVHPRVIREIKEQSKRLAKEKKYKVVVIEVPLLFESGLHRIVDRVVVVTASRSTQLSRLYKKTRLSRADILRRIKRQMPLAKKVCWADFVINNSGTLLQTRKQVQVIWNKFKNVGK